MRKHARLFFKPAARYPADPRAVFILALSVFSGLTTLAIGAAPGTLEAILPTWGIILWSVLLTGGSVVALVGMAIQTINGIIAEQIGSVMVGAATVFYSGLAIYVVGPSALSVVGIVFAWGLACFVRWIQLWALIADSIAKAEARQVERAVQGRIDPAVEDERNG
jgi:hypothetical protein